MAQAGIERLKKDLTILGKLVKTVDKALEDGKVNLVEGIGIAFKVADLIKVAKTFKEAKHELLDLTAEESIELENHFRQEFDLRNDQAEMVVEMMVELALQVAISMEVIGEIKTE